MTSQNNHPYMRPRDAATLIIVRRADPNGEPSVLMGKRHAAHKFMPNKFVFPGGRMELADCRVHAANELHPQVEARLLAKMRGRVTANRARGLALAAVRETFEEAGLIIGAKQPKPLRTRSPDWQPFFDTGHAPDLSALRLFARAITPPGRPRRFDTRFFVTDAQSVSNIDAPVSAANEELLDPYWFTIQEALELDLPWITGQILKRLHAALTGNKWMDPSMSCTYQRKIGNEWRYETL